MIKQPKKAEVRQRIRRQRRSISVSQQQTAANQLAQTARLCRQLWPAHRILSYAPFKGEICPSALLKTLATPIVYLPKITNYRNHSMQFYAAEQTSTHNKFGIREPRGINQPLPANQLDLILLPMVAFDRSGNRIGMGAGFYDRALSSLVHQASTKPLLIGLAHYFQEVESIQASEWDVKLDAILTDREYIPVSPNLSI